jgi:hypothetical protein
VFLLDLAGLALLAVLGWTLWVWRQRWRVERGVSAHACKACGASFADDAIAEHLGRIGHEDVRRLDLFQRRFARHRVRCGNCGAVNITTADGIPFKAWYEEPAAPRR